MDLLPKKEVNILKQKERKSEIDEGLMLSHQVEELRKLRLKEEKNLIDYRESVIGAIKEELMTLLEEKKILVEEVSVAIEERKKLLAPLDSEWKQLDRAKEQIIEDKQLLYLDFERLKIEHQKDKEVKKSIALSIKKARKIETEAQGLFSEAVTFKENAENEYSMAKNEHDIQSKEYGLRLDEVQLLKDSYQNGINVNKIDEKKLQEWEGSLIIREVQLQDRESTLERELNRKT